MEAISVMIKNSRQKSAGSSKNRIPIRVVPTAPIPVQTAYAVPMGRVWVALYSRYMLRVRLIKNPAIHSRELVPLVMRAFARQVVKPISNNPAMISSIQFIGVKIGSFCRAHRWSGFFSCNSASGLYTRWFSWAYCSNMIVLASLISPLVTICIAFLSVSSSTSMFSCSCSNPPPSCNFICLLYSATNR